MAIFAMGSMAQNQKDEAQMNRFIYEFAGTNGNLQRDGAERMA